MMTQFQNISQPRSNNQIRPTNPKLNQGISVMLQLRRVPIAGPMLAVIAQFHLLQQVIRSLLYV